MLWRQLAAFSAPDYTTEIGERSCPTTFPIFMAWPAVAIVVELPTDLIGSYNRSVYLGYIFIWQ